MKKKKNERPAVGRSAIEPSISGSSVIEQHVSGSSIDSSVATQGAEGLPSDTSFVKWQMFVKVVHAHIDPVLASMFFETDFIQFDQSKKIIHLVTLKKFTMFQDLFIEQKANYQEYLDRIFGFKTVLVVEFIKIAEKKKMEEEKGHTVGSQSGHQSADRKVSDRSVGDRTGSDRNANDRNVRVSLSKNEKNIDITDEKKWKLTHTLLEHFGGTVREIIKDSNEFDA